jgi:hypothetical protein
MPRGGANDELPFHLLFAAVAACVEGVTQDELLQEDEDPLATASYLVADSVGLRLDHRHDRENAVHLLVQAVRRAGVDLALEGEGRGLALVTAAETRVPLRLTHADVEQTFKAIVAEVPSSVARVFTLSPSDHTDTHLFAVLPVAQVALVTACLGKRLPALMRDVGKRPRSPRSYRVVGAPGAPSPRATAATSAPREIGFGYTSDGQVVLGSRGQRIAVKDPASARALHAYWLADARHAYFLGSPVRGLDPHTLAVLHPHVARDQKRVFFGATPLEVDVDAFEVLAGRGRIPSECWGRDRSAVYFFEDLDSAPKKLTTANPSTFRVVGEHATDGHSVWAHGRLLKGALAASWRSLPGGLWSTDGKRVYFLHHRLPKADATSFEPVLEFWAMDKNHVYDRMRLATPDAARTAAGETFAFIGDTRLAAREPENENGLARITLTIRCKQWLRRPPRLDDTPDVGGEHHASWYLRPATLPETLEGPRILVVTASPRDKRFSVVRPSPAWEYQTLDRLAVMERWLALSTSPSV